MSRLEQRLQALAADAFPEAPDVRAAVAARIVVKPRGRARLRGRRRVLALACALVLVPTAAVAAVPDARDAVLDWLGIAHLRVERVPRVPRLPALNMPDLGRRVASIEAAGRRAGYAVAVPRALGPPDAIYVDDGKIVSLAYRPRASLPADPQTGLGVLVTELPARGIPQYFAKTVGPGTQVTPVRVRNANGAFISGAAHKFLIERPDGMIADVPPRLAGNTLAFEYGDLVIRIEGRFDEHSALSLANSLPPAGG